MVDQWRPGETECRRRRGRGRETGSGGHSRPASRHSHSDSIPGTHIHHTTAAETPLYVYTAATRTHTALTQHDGRCDSVLTAVTGAS